MVNYKRVVCELAILSVLAALTTAAPAPDCREPHYDQRQNGTENYRINVDGVVVAVAPAESLLAAASDLDFSDLFDLDDLSDFQKPKPPAENKPPKPLLEPKPQEASKPPAPATGGADDKPLSDVSLANDLPGQKKEVPVKKQEKAHRFKNRLASLLIPLLRKTRHH